MTSRNFQARLLRRAQRAGIALPDGLGARLETYYTLLANWNQKINLTGLDLVEPTPEALDRLLIEPLIAARHVSPIASTMLDVGSGGGSPAIPIGLAVPQLALTMVESKTRKSVFLREAVRVLEMRAEVVTSRFEELLARPEHHESHDLVTVRAVRMEARLLMTLQAFARRGGQIFLFRGAGVTDPRELIAPPLVWLATYPLLESLRSRLVVLEKRQASGFGRLGRTFA